MIEITNGTLFAIAEYLSLDEQPKVEDHFEDPEEIDAALTFLDKGYEMKIVVADGDLKSLHLGGDDVINIAESTVKLVEEGWDLHTWFGVHGET